mgnify:CR=1 FL=1
MQDKKLFFLKNIRIAGVQIGGMCYNEQTGLYGRSKIRNGRHKKTEVFDN